MKNDIPIIFEDDNLLVINKPSGLSVHGDGFNKEEKTLTDWLLERYPDEEGEVGLARHSFSDVGESMFTQKGEEIKKPGIVHRLDKETSGVMIIAKNQEAFLYFKKQFQNHEVKKIYRAILSGHVNLPAGEEKVLDWPIGRSKNDPRIRVARSGGKGKMREAITIFRLLENICANYAYIEAEPKSGRTHQLRAHFKAYNHPIIGDHLYNSIDNGGGAIGRTALHAYSLELKSLAGELITYVASLPPDFEGALEKLKASC